MEPTDQPEGYAARGGDMGTPEQRAPYEGEQAAPDSTQMPEGRAPGTEEEPTTVEAEAHEEAEQVEEAGETEEAEQPEEGEPEREQEHEAPAEPVGPRIQIDVVDGDFSVRGGSRQVVLHAHGDDADDEVEDSSGTLRFAWLPGDSELRVPDGAEIEVRRIEGDFDGRRLDGIVVAHHVAGDVTLEDMAAVELHHVDGDLQASHCGTVRARMVAGDARVANLHRAPLLGTVAGDLHAEHLPGLELRESVSGDVVIVECGDVSLLGTVGGDLHVERSVLTIRASAIGGDARLGAVRAATIAAVGGDLKVTGAPGPIEVSSVGGDARIRHATALVRLGTVGGDLDALEVRGGVIARRIGGDATLETGLGEGAEYEIHAAGDISLRVRGEVNARFVAQTFGGEIRTRLPLTVEKGRRRNLVGVLGRGDATVTLRSDGGDISLAATDRFEEEHTMGDEFVGRDRERERDERSWEGSLGGRRFRVSWDRGPGRAGFRFQGPFGENEDPDAMAGGASRDFNFEWEKGHGPRMSGEYEERMNEMRDRAERVARRAAEEAQRYAEKAAKRARETDWEAVGREVRSAIEKAMGELEDTFNQVRRDWETRRPTGSGGSSSRPAAQRVKIEYDDDPDAAGAAGAAGAQASASRDDADAQRRAILEQLRAGTLSLDEAERRLNELR